MHSHAGSRTCLSTRVQMRRRALASRPAIAFVCEVPLRVLWVPPGALVRRCNRLRHSTKRLRFDDGVTTRGALAACERWP